MTKFQIHLSFCVLWLVGVGLLWFVFIPEAQVSRENQATSVQEQELRLGKQEKRVASYQAVLDRYRDNQAGIRALKNYLSRDPSETQHAISAAIEELARKHYLGLSRVTYQNGKGKRSDLLTMAIDLPLSGGYRDFRAFLIDLAEQEPYLAIQEIQVEGSDFSGTLEIDLGLTSYFAMEAGHGQ